MGGRKRKSTSSEPQRTQSKYKTKQRKVAETAVRPVASLEQNENDLKTIFSKVQTIFENGKTIYKIKDLNELPIDLNVNPTTHNSTTNTISDDTDLIPSSTTTVCSQIPDFSTEDIDELINYSDLSLFMDDNSLNEVDTSYLFESTTAFPTLSTPDVTDRPEPGSKITLGVDFTIPLDLSINEKKVLPDSTPLPSKSSNVSTTQIPTYANTMRTHDQYKMPLTYSAPKTVNEIKTWTAGKECSSTTTNCTLTPTEPKKRTLSSSFKGDSEYKISEHKKSPTMLLDEMLGMQAIHPEYTFDRYLNRRQSSVLQCCVHFGDNRAFGTGLSVMAAKNAAANSLLDKLISMRYFGNVIGSLQEFCTVQNMRLPHYTDEMKVRVESVNEHIFFVACTVEQFREVGQGRSKKMAKLFAAYKMCSKLNVKRIKHV